MLLGGVHLLVGGSSAIMALASQVCSTFIHSCLWMLLVTTLTGAIKSDVSCLRALKSQLKDPNRHLSNWVFGNKPQGYICEFNGVNCWHDDENMVLNIDLGGFGLQGEFPSGVKECSSMTSLNLSGNHLHGSIPSESSAYLQYLVTLDLSSNGFSGEIPASWSKIVYLNTLLLDHNKFTGRIPQGIASNPRLTKFSVAHNLLKGPIPEFANHHISLSSFEGNPDLCGFPLDDTCSDSFFSMFLFTAIIAAAFFFPLGAAIGWFM